MASVLHLANRSRLASALDLFLVLDLTLLLVFEPSGSVAIALLRAPRDTLCL
jgi:hypothetical protein